jgi:hypothetical protein
LQNMAAGNTCCECQHALMHNAAHINIKHNKWNWTWICIPANLIPNTMCYQNQNPNYYSWVLGSFLRAHRRIQPTSTNWPTKNGCNPLWSWTTKRASKTTHQFAQLLKASKNTTYDEWAKMNATQKCVTPANTTAQQW